MRILIYEPNSLIRDGLITVFIVAGYEIVIVRDKRLILSMLGKRPFVVAILDVVNDDEDMMNILRTIHSDVRYSNVKVMAHILDPTKESMSEMLKIGVFAFLFKPFIEKDFLSRFELILQKNNLMPKRKCHTVINNINLSLSFRNDETRQMLNARVVELSTISMRFVPGYENTSISVGNTINNASLSVAGTNVQLSVTVVGKDGPEYIANITDITSFNMKLLCKIIYDKYIELLK